MPDKLNVSLDTDEGLRTVVDLLIGPDFQDGSKGLLSEKFETPAMRTLYETHQTAKDLAKRKGACLERLRSGTFAGRTEFFSAITRYRQNHQKQLKALAKRDRLIAQAQTATGAEKARLQSEAVKLHSQIGKSLFDHAEAVRKTGRQFSDSLIAQGAGEQSAVVRSFIDAPEQSLHTNGWDVRKQIDQALADQIDEHDKAAKKAQKAYRHHKTNSAGKRLRIGNAIVELDRFSKRAEFDKALALHNSSIRLKKAYDKARADHEARRSAKGPSKVTKIALDKSKKALAKAKADYEAVGAAEHPHDSLARAAETIARELPKGYTRRVALEALVANLRIKRMGADHEKVKAQMKKMTEGFEQGGLKGATAETALTIEAGGYGGIGVAKLEVTALVGLNQKIERVRGKKDGDKAWKSTFTHNEQLSINTKVANVVPSAKNKTALKANLTGGAEFAKSRTYDTLEELMTGESAVAMNLLCIGAKADTSKGKKLAATFLNQREDLLAIAHQTTPELEKLLSLTTGKSVELSSTLPSFQKGPSVTTNSKAMVGSIGGAVGHGGRVGHSAVGAANVSYKHKRSANHTYLTVPYLKSVRDDQKRQRQHQMAHPDYFAFYNFDGDAMTNVEYGASAVQKLNKIESEIAEAQRTLKDGQATAAAKQEAKQSLTQYRDALWANVTGLRFEYDQYVARSNAIRLRRIADNKANRADRDVALTARRLNPKDTAGFIQAATLHYAVLERLYGDTFTGDEQMAGPQASAMEALAADLETPKIGLTQREIADKFGYKAEAAPTKVNSNTITFGFSGGWKKGTGLLDLSDGADNIADGKGAASAGLSVNVEANFEETWKPGKTVADKKLTIDFMLAHGGGVILDGDNNLSTIVGRLLSGSDVLRIFKSKSPEDQAQAKRLTNECVKALAGLLATPVDGPCRLELIQPPGKPTRWVLREAMRYSQQERSLGARAAFGADSGVVAGFNLMNRKRRLVSTYRTASTLSDIGLTYRTNNPTGAANDAEWKRFKDDSKLLDRLVEGLDAEVAKGPTWQQKGQQAPSFEALLTQAANGKIKSDPVLMDGKHRSILAGDLIALLQGVGGEIKDSDSDEVKAEKQSAATFVDAWRKRNALAKKKADGGAVTPKDLNDAVVDVKDALEGLIVAKSNKETRTFADGFQKPTGFSADDIRRLAIRDLSEKFADLRARSGAKARTVPGLRTELFKAYAAAPADQKAKRLVDLKRALALNYAASTLDDLSMFEDESDKDKALGHLSAGLGDLLGDEPKVYANEMMDGELVEDDGKLKLKLVVKPDYVKAVDNKILERSFNATIKAITSGVDDAPIDATFSLENVEIASDGGVSQPEANGQGAINRRKWSTNLADPDEQDKAFQALADKQISPKFNRTRIGRRNQVRSQFGRRNHADILKAIAVVLEQQNHAKRKQPGPSPVGAKAKH